ncbi:MAG TPA: hypothetical protein VN851_03240 [Thermoanaerobaculia bacterium]|nr:hypothetical protein [Thermoanaerobaculia bacterium]
MDINLDLIGRAYLDHVDYRVSNLAIMLLIGVIAIHRRAKLKQWVPLQDVVRAALGFLMISTALTIFCVFMLTKPPYLEALSGDNLSTTAFITVFVMLGLGISEIAKLYRNK